jgi:UDPglucose--hexose-1-phosphate uridylyltransferase
MSELRWNPVTREWVIMATKRQKRPVMPSKGCPFDVGSEETPEDYDLLALPNRFPSLQLDAPEPESVDSFYKSAPGKGVCEVILYSSDHEGVLGEYPLDHMIRLVDLWKERYEAVGAEEAVDYVFIFENRGEEIGVTLQHPHGQLYGYPFIPPFIERRLEGAKVYHEEEKNCLFCDTIKHELVSEDRLIHINDGFIAFVPYWSKWSYEVNILSRRHIGSLSELRDYEKLLLAEALKTILQKYDRLFGFKLPFIMVLHQDPTDGGDYPYHHFAIEFYPPHRSEDKLKYLAGSETGAGAHINVTNPEEAAAELRGVMINDV